MIFFFVGLLNGQINCMTIDKLDDHWADLVDNHLGIKMEERDLILDY